MGKLTISTGHCNGLPKATLEIFWTRARSFFSVRKLLKSSVLVALAAISSEVVAIELGEVGLLPRSTAVGGFPVRFFRLVGAVGGKK